MIKTEFISQYSRVVRRDGNVVSDMDGEKVMLNIAKGKYYNLGVIGGSIWEIISKPTKVNEIITTLIADYEVERSICEQQVLSFFYSLKDEDLILVINEG